MKAVPILIALNVVAWGLILLLFVRQGSLESQLASLQPGAGVPPEAPAGALADRITALEARLGDAEADPSLGMEPADMELFRKQVRKAQELNVQEDQLLRIVENIDRLVEDKRIGALSPEQEQKAARIVMATNRKLLGISGRVRQDYDIANMTSEERRQVIREEYERVRIEARSELEGVVPAADAEVIVDDRFRFPQSRTKPR
jgi:hypothetical protein